MRAAPRQSRRRAFAPLLHPPPARLPQSDVSGAALARGANGAEARCALTARAPELQLHLPRRITACRGSKTRRVGAADRCGPSAHGHDVVHARDVAARHARAPRRAGVRVLPRARRAAEPAGVRHAEPAEARGARPVRPPTRTLTPSPTRRCTCSTWRRCAPRSRARASCARRGRLTSGSRASPSTRSATTDWRERPGRHGIDRRRRPHPRHPLELASKPLSAIGRATSSPRSSGFGRGTTARCARRAACSGSSSTRRTRRSGRALRPRRAAVCAELQELADTCWPTSNPGASDWSRRGDTCPLNCTTWARNHAAGGAAADARGEFKHCPASLGHVVSRR